ncbi:hypothetical protein [Deinococcus arcticus]|uniref:PD(D/E)XK endonuclease domain-containing protein n=1 Tax=Deinococcus arcticus TaxID=2136176 RepID=A0A2T3W609_9DEIO|nr:hypothetical protein [Deinococcus arcticus]PTA67336.1 hypothetical protein C8263_13650 [Deinococcus arcticus]
MYKKTIDEPSFVAAHARGCKDAELAALFGISLATVKRRRQHLGLGSNCHHNNRGKLAEQLTAQLLSASGAEVTPSTHHRAPFDLLVNGWRVDVKLGYCRSGQSGTGATYEFRLEASRSSHFMTHKYGKDYQRDTDFLALVILNEQQTDLKYLYLLPASAWQPTVTVRPDSPFCPFQPYLGRLSPLTARSGAA